MPDGREQAIRGERAASTGGKDIKWASSPLFFPDGERIFVVGLGVKRDHGRRHPNGGPVTESKVAYGVERVGH